MNEQTLDVFWTKTVETYIQTYQSHLSAWLQLVLLIQIGLILLPRQPKKYNQIEKLNEIKLNRKRPS